MDSLQGENSVVEHDAFGETWHIMAYTAHGQPTAIRGLWHPQLPHQLVTCDHRKGPYFWGGPQFHGRATVSLNGAVGSCQFSDTGRVVILVEIHLG